MNEGLTLMQRVEDGYQMPNGRIEWTPQNPYPVTSANRARLLKRDADYPTGADGWKVVPHGSIEGVYQRICWEDIRVYAEAGSHE